jgi:hypothetical protein
MAVSSALSAAVSAMATAARFSSGAGSPARVRVKAAQRPAIFRRVVSSNGRGIPLDYITFALDGMSAG